MANQLSAADADLLARVRDFLLPSSDLTPDEQRRADDLVRRGLLEPGIPVHVHHHDGVPSSDPPPLCRGWRLTLSGQDALDAYESQIEHDALEKAEEKKQRTRDRILNMLLAFLGRLLGFALAALAVRFLHL